MGKRIQFMAQHCKYYRLYTKMVPTIIDIICRVKGTNMDHGTNIASGLFSVSKKHYLQETIRNIQREQKNIVVSILRQRCRLKESYPCFSKM